MVETQCFECGPVATNTYVVCNTTLGEAFCVDVPLESMDEILKAVTHHNCTLTAILLTHTHWDHTGDCADLKRRTGARVYVHPADSYRIEAPNAHTVWPLPFDLQPVRPDVLVDDGSTITVAGIQLGVLFTPGHTEGGVCYTDAARRRVFVGDTLFNSSIGRTDLPGGNTEQLLQSIRSKLLSLPPDYTILPGHGPSSTIDIETQTNPFLAE